MDYNGLLNAICDDGEAEVMTAYHDRPDKRDGALQGFAEARMTASPDDLRSLLASANKDTEDAFRRQDERYWFWRMRALQIEWCANVISGALFNQGRPVIVAPTARGMFKAADILGTARES